MNRTTAILLTTVTTLLCGIPSLLLCAFGSVMVTGANSPEFRDGFIEGSKGMSPDIILPIGLGVVAVSCVLIIIPIVVGVISLRMSKAQETP